MLFYVILIWYNSTTGSCTLPSCRFCYEFDGRDHQQYCQEFVNSAFHPSGVCKSRTSLTGLGEGGLCSLVSGGR